MCAEHRPKATSELRTGRLPWISYAYTPARSPPRRLPALDTPLKSPIPPVGSHLQPWNAYENLDPSLDELPDFEPWGEGECGVSGCDDIGDEYGEAQISDPFSGTSKRYKASSKGKWRATNLEHPVLFPGLRPDESLPTRILGNAGHHKTNRHKVDAHESQAEWAADSKRRKSQWRKLITLDPVYGQFWSFIPPVSHLYRSVTALSAAPLVRPLIPRRPCSAGPDPADTRLHPPSGPQ